MNKLMTTTMLTLFITVGYSHAQVNVEKFRGKSSLNFSLAYSQAETSTNETKTLLFNMLANKVIGENEYLAVGGATISEKNDVDFTNKKFLHFRYYRNLNSWGPEAFLQLTENAFSNERERKIIGAGVRKTFQKDDYAIKGGIALFAENLKLEQELDGVTQIVDLDLNRANFYVNYTRTIFSATIYYQPNTDDLDEYNIALESMLTFKLWKDRLMLDIIYNITRNKTLDIENSLFKQAFRWKI